MKTALIIGAGKGMGNHIAEKFAHEGYKIGLIARNKKSLDDYVDEFTQKGYDVFSKEADILDSEKFMEIMEDLTKKHDIEVVVYNAAIMEATNVTELTSSAMMDHFRVNLLGAEICVEKVLPCMIKKGEGASIYRWNVWSIPKCK